VEAVLGVNCARHDTSAALLVDGQLVAFGEEERFNRDLHTAEFPNQAIGSGLRQGGIDIDDVDYVAVAHEALGDLRRAGRDGVRRRAPAAVAARAVADTRIASKTRLIRRAWGYRGPILNVAHHVAHAAGTYFSGPFEEAAVLTLDRDGDFVSATTSIGRANHVALLSEIHNPNSLGEVYTSLTRFLGFRRDDEGTVMDLAAYGTPRYVDRMRDLVTLTADGRFTVNLEWLGSDRPGRPMSPAFLARFGGVRPPESDISERDKDIAYAAQDLAEQSALHMGRWLRRASSSPNLCLSGGMALNPVLNSRLLSEAGFDDIWVPPTAGAAGNALGAALWVWHEYLGRARTWRMTEAHAGEAWGDDECATALRRAGLPCRRVASPAAEAAKRLSDSKVIGWFHGRAEAGPNALGARSVLADPRRADMREVVSERVTKREWFRPYGASVLDRRGPDVFHGYRPSPFMLLAPPLRESMRTVIPACAHVDGTSRVQSVTAAGNPEYHDLIERFEAHTGVGVILNTSFSLPGEPMVHRPGEAVSDFLRSGMDALVLGSYVVDKPGG
jgi:carbamoyltransferase